MDSSSTPCRDCYRDVARVVVPAGGIAARVCRLAADFARTYDGLEVTILAVMTGSIIFLADLIRCMPNLMRLNLISVSTYGSGTVSQGVKQPPALPDLAGKHVLIVDDIYDTGATLGHLVEAVGAQGPVSLRTCVLLSKERSHGRVWQGEPDFVGFRIAYEFVVGYGLDFDHLYRNLPDICVLKQHARNA